MSSLTEEIVTDLSVLFQPGQIGSLTLKNRIIKSPQSTALSNMDGTVSQRSVNHYKRLAEGGAGLVLTEYTYIDEDASKAIHCQLGNTRREHIPGMGWLVDEVHAVGAKIGMQLAHGGRQKFLGTAPIKAASEDSWDEVEAQYGVKPVSMTIPELEQVMEDFGDAALRCWLARFDLVEVHAGHGYLITNFLSPFTNHRTDEYGGSFENRIRLLMGIVHNIRRKIPPEMPLSIRISVVDYEKDGIAIEETIELCRRLEAAGVDVIHCSGGHHALMQYEVSPWYMPRALHRWGFEKIKQALRIPVIGSGSIVAPEVAADIVGSGSADFISLGRPLLADPDWPNKAREGRVKDIVPCIRCNDGCLQRGLNVGRSAGCTVNPSMGEEYRYPIEIVRSAKRVAVVGGGPAGLRAAAVLADKGHQVTLYESGPLGGQLSTAVRHGMKFDLKALRDHLIHQVQTRNTIRIVPERASGKQLLEANYDHIILATGRTPAQFDGQVSGALSVISAADISDPQEIEGPVVIIGAGMTGCDTAVWLQNAGKNDVTLIDEANGILSRGYVFTDLMGMPELLSRHSINVQVSTKALAIEAGGVRVSNAQQKETLVTARTVIVACGYEGVNALQAELAQLAPALPVDVIGTAHRDGRVMDALHDAFFTARRC
jgi:2,4-dienoyl-CoA reductase-like NADH-dependent reductase (Old Yellow Enzyme family)/thioredoxin reductase